jgi:hypothetical protein
MMAHGEMDIVPLYLDTSLNRAEWQVSCPGRFIPAELARYLFYRNMSGIQSGCGRYGEEKNSAPAENQTPTPRSSIP